MILGKKNQICALVLLVLKSSPAEPHRAANSDLTLLETTQTMAVEISQGGLIVLMKTALLDKVTWKGPSGGHRKCRCCLLAT